MQKHFLLSRGTQDYAGTTWHPSYALIGTTQKYYYKDELFCRRNNCYPKVVFFLSWCINRYLEALIIIQDYGLLQEIFNIFPGDSIAVYKCNFYPKVLAVIQYHLSYFELSVFIQKFWLLVLVSSLISEKYFKIII